MRVIATDGATQRGLSIVWARPPALQKRLNRLRCRLRNRVDCTLAPSDKYDGSWRCEWSLSLLSQLVIGLITDQFSSPDRAIGPVSVLCIGVSVSRQQRFSQMFFDPVI